MKIAEIRALTAEELVEKIESAKVEYQQMLLTHAVSPLEDTSRIMKARRDIARMKTVLNEIQKAK
ncbi:MAG: 50S ribosomal protein L29 [Bacteroidaceae bacterium]|nr:50S ribosomal protein L29 [Bacteroidaceae bacterium]